MYVCDMHTNVEKNHPASRPDPGSQDDILENLTQAFVQSKEKSIAIAQKMAGLIQWNLDLTKSLGTGQMCSLNGGFVISNTSI